MTNACTFEVAKEDDMSSGKILKAGWGQSGDLFTGGLLVDAVSGRIRGSSRGVNLQDRIEHPQSITIQFNISKADANCIARISSTVNGVEAIRQVNVIDGASVTLRGQAFSVVARDFTAPAISTDVKYNVGILAAIGERAGYKQPPILAPLTFGTTFAGPFTSIIASQIVVAPGATRFVQIPEDSGANSVYVTADPATVAAGYGFTVNHYTFAGAIRRRYNPLTWPDWVPIAPGAFAIGLENSAASPDNVSFAVTFGIDG